MPLRAYGVTLGDLYAAWQRATCLPAAASSKRQRRVHRPRRRLDQRRRGHRETVVKEVSGTRFTSRPGDRATRTQFRRSVYEKNGNEVVRRAVLMRHGENPLEVTVWPRLPAARL